MVPLANHILGGGGVALCALCVSARDRRLFVNPAGRDQAACKITCLGVRIIERPGRAAEIALFDSLFDDWEKERV